MRYSELCKKKLKKDGYDSYYGKHVELSIANTNEEARVRCPFHDDKGPSMSVNLESGTWCCHGACDAGGDVFGFKARLDGKYTEHMSVETFARELAIEMGYVLEITDEDVEVMHQRLVTTPSLIQVVEEQMHLTGETIKEFKLGWKDNRVVIPVRGESGFYEDCRMYNKRLDPKIRHYAANHGMQVRVLPLATARREKNLTLFAGEKDCMRAVQCGVNGAITFTSGEGSLPDIDYLLRVFKGKTVDVVYDVDEIGQKSAESAAKAIASVADVVRIVQLPREGLPDNGDFSDVANMVGDDRALEFLDKARRDATIVRAPRAPAMVMSSRSDEEAILVDFSKISRHDTYGKKLKVIAHTTGASAGMKNYQFARNLRVMCGRDRGKMCDACSVMSTPIDQMPMRVELDPVSEESLQLIQTPIDKKHAVIRKIVGIPLRCDSVVVTEESRSAVQMLLLSDSVQMNKMREGINGHHAAYYHGEGLVDNRDYEIECYVHASPKSQESVISIASAEPVRSILENFEVTEATLRAIEYMRPQNRLSVAEHFDWLYGMLESMAKVYGRKDVMRCILNSIYSALSFKVGNKLVEAGWIESLIVGDTRTGKSEMARNLMRIIDVGEFIGCENVSAAGLIGGIQIIDGASVPVWGKLPQNDKGFVVLDEMLELGDGPAGIMGKLSSLRSSGVAEITKIQQAATPARVRQVHISNPKYGQRVATFDCGVRAIPTVIRNSEDIARYTCATIVSEESVDVDTILRDEVGPDSAVVGKHLNELAMLTWSLRVDQIVFEDSTVAYLKTAVKEMSLRYHPSLPIWEKGSGLTKLSRLCVPVAVLCGSFVVNSDGVPVLKIKPEHAVNAVQSLKQLYDNRAMGYDRFSRQEFDREHLVDEAQVRDSILEYKDTHNKGITARHLLRFFMMNDELNRDSLIALMAYRTQAEILWSVLLRNHAIVSSRHGRDVCHKTPVFVRLLERMDQNFSAVVSGAAPINDVDRARVDEAAASSNVWVAAYEEEPLSDVPFS